jgi:hypothetical protein
MILIVFAVLFLVVLFLIKNGLLFGNKETGVSDQQSGLIYSTAIVGDLVNKDTDGDGVLDWEEGLWGTDPLKKETTPGVSDSVTINKLKGEAGGNSTGAGNANNSDSENLTETDKFSRELFSTIATLNQSGSLDQATIDKITGSLADHIKNSPSKKIFSVLDIKTTMSETPQAFRNYNDALNNVYKKYPAIQYTILDVLQQFMIDENTVDSSVLVKLDPIIEQINKTTAAMAKITVPQSLSILHLTVLNAQERLAENLSAVRLYDSDSVVALGGISKYEENSTELGLALNNLANALSKKLKN